MSCDHWTYLSVSAAVDFSCGFNEAVLELGSVRLKHSYNGVFERPRCRDVIDVSSL